MRSEPPRAAAFSRVNEVQRGLQAIATLPCLVLKKKPSCNAESESENLTLGYKSQDDSGSDGRDHRQIYACIV